MSRCKLKYLLCAQILFGLCNAFPGSISQNTTAEQGQDSEGNLYGLPTTIELIKFTYPPRLLRESMETKLEILFGIAGLDQSTTLTLVEDRDLVDRATTGIFFAESDANAHQKVRYTPRPDFFDDIGEIQFFQNLDDLSALTRFKNLSSGEVTYWGVLKEKYFLKDTSDSFSLDFGWTSMFGFIHYIEKTGKLPDPEPIVEVYRNGVLVEAASNRTKREDSPPVTEPPTVVYPKIMLSPSFNLTRREKGLPNFVREMISYMNCVDMSYRRLSNPKIHLHISGIIIPLDEKATPYILPHYKENYTLFQTINYAAFYFASESIRFPFNTYDIVAPLTEKYLTLDYGFGITELAGGVTQMTTLCNRVNGFAAAGAVVAVSYSMDHNGLVYMTHELGHVFNASHEGEDNAADCDKNGQFSMATSYYATLKWSSCNQRSISTFLSSEAAACTHYAPATIAVPEAVKSKPGAWLSIDGQCQNQFNDTTSGFCMAGPPGNSCRSYSCWRNGMCLVGFDPQSPLEGSMCRDGQRCINGDCVDISSTLT